MINTLNITPSAEEERFIAAVASLIEIACKDNKNLAELEKNMTQNISELKRLHPQYCIEKAKVIENFVDMLKNGGHHGRQ